MASIILSKVGSSLGEYFMPGIGGSLIGSVGSKLGKIIDKETGWSDSATGGGARLENLKVQDSRYGRGISKIFGQARLAGNVIWCSDLIETTHETSNGLIGKGGGGISIIGSSQTSYSYSIHCAIAIAEGEIDDIATIWADTEVIYKDGVWKSGLVEQATIYKGTADQNSDALMESFIGNGQVPAYRGLAYIVLESFQLADFGSRLPNLTFEVVPRSEIILPEWSGEKNAGFAQAGSAAASKSMDPIVLEGSTNEVRKILVGGYTQNVNTAVMRIVGYDVTGDEPQEFMNVESPSFAYSAPPGHAWARSRGGRYVALCVTQTSTTTTHSIMLFDTSTQQFGDILTLNSTYVTASKSLAWIDSQRFVMVDTQSGHLGVRVFMRAGLSVVDLGFFDVWGAGSYGAFAPLSYAQFSTHTDGVYCYMGNAWPTFTAMYGRFLSWSNGQLFVGEKETLVEGHNSGTPNAPQMCLLKANADEWCFVHTTLLVTQMMSFKPSMTGLEVTRPWQAFGHGTFIMSVATHPVPYGAKMMMVQRNAYDSDYYLSVFTLDENSFTRTETDLIVQNAPAGSDFLSAFAVSRSRMMIMPLEGGSGYLSSCGLVTFSKSETSLASIVRTILERAGYDQADINVDVLEDIQIDGYMLDDPMSASDALTPLQVFYPFDLVESDNEIKAVLRNAASVATIKETDLCIPDQKRDSVVLYEKARAQELDLPLQVAVDYIDASRDYEIGSQRARRTTTQGAKTHVKLSLPIVCTATKAKEIAEKRLREVWGERETVRFFLSQEWLSLESGDIVQLEQDLVRILEIQRQGMLQEIKGVLTSPVLDHEIDADWGSSILHQTPAEKASTLYLLDLPLLRRDDNKAGFYAAVSGEEGWPGGSLWRSWGDSQFNLAASMPRAIIAGSVVNQVGTAQSYFMDKVNIIDVQLDQGELENCSEENLLQGVNAALIGNEIIQFQQARLLGDGYYRLSGLLRGRRGTEEEINNHQKGERFILLQETRMHFLPLDLNDRGREAVFRAPTNGQTLGSVPDHNAVFSCRTLQPFAPVHVRAVREEGRGTDLTLSWIRRARLDAAWIDLIDVPLDENQERYDVEIIKDDIVLRLFSDIDQASLIYTASMQTQDWGTTIPETYQLKIYQISARYGRGQACSATVKS